MLNQLQTPAPCSHQKYFHRNCIHSWLAKKANYDIQEGIAHTASAGVVASNLTSSTPQLSAWVCKSLGFCKYKTSFKLAMKTTEHNSEATRLSLKQIWTMAPARFCYSIQQNVIKARNNITIFLVTPSKLRAKKVFSWNRCKSLPRSSGQLRTLGFEAKKNHPIAYWDIQNATFCDLSLRSTDNSWTIYRYLLLCSTPCSIHKLANCILIDDSYLISLPRAEIVDSFTFSHFGFKSISALGIS